MPTNTVQRPGIALYYSIPDHYPSFRVDVSELIAKSLSDTGVVTDWFMANNNPNQPAGKVDYFSQTCTLPPKLKGQSKLKKLLSKVLYWTTDAFFLIKAATQHYQVIQTRDKYFSSVVALISAKLSGKKFIYWCSYPFPEHELSMARERDGLARTVMSAYGRFVFFVLYKVVMKYADHSFVQSERMREDIARYGVPPVRMTPVPMGVPARLLAWAETTQTAVVPGRVVYTGTLAEIRQLHVLIDAFALVKKRHPEASLLMVGDGNKPHERTGLEEQVARFGLSDSVVFTGFVPIEDAWSFAASASVCVSPVSPIPVLESASPTKLVEYMALGRPVVCNDHPEQSDIIRDSGAGICVAWSAPAFAEAICQLLQQPAAAEQMAAKGPAWVASHRTYPQIAAKVYEQYTTILGAQ